MNFEHVLSNFKKYVKDSRIYLK